jgi:hypothetical protein
MMHLLLRDGNGLVVKMYYYALINPQELLIMQSILLAQ